MENKKLKDIYEELYNLMKEEVKQNSLNHDLSNLEHAKEIFKKNSCFELEEIKNLVDKNIETINKLIEEKNKLVEKDFKKILESKLNNLFEDYIEAVHHENKDGLIKHDIIIEMSSSKGYSIHIKNMLNYISAKSNVNLVREELYNDSSDIKKIYLTMTSKDFINIHPFVQQKMKDNKTNFEVRSIYPDIKNRTLEDHNNLLNQNNQGFLSLQMMGAFIGYFSNQTPFDMRSSAKKFIKECFVEAYEYSFLLNQNKKNLPYLNYLSQDIMSVYAFSDNRKYNPFTEWEYKENQSQENTFENKPKRPRI